MLRSLLLLVVAVLCAGAVHASRLDAQPMSAEAARGDVRSSLSSLFGGMTIKLHGNYCGVNHGDATYQTPPVDEIDAVCQRHDQCYDKRYLDCGCDHEMLKALQAGMKTPGLDPFVVNKARTMYQWFQSSPCSCLRETGEGEFKRTELERASYREKGKCRSVSTLDSKTAAGEA